ncbi:acyltransferase family protein [Bacteroides sp. AN502(2024)]|uniref:acyltransferase family protein n=1 Tax=Bacteroides sp. AN502(2024) TaxID=3160599 RepID=UPI003510FC1A
MSQYLSDKLTILYTLLIIMVVYIHSYYLEAEQYPIAYFLQKLIGGGICRIANCLFFCISGYLFARNIHTAHGVSLKLKKRLCTLLIPYVLWNVIFVLWYVVLALIPDLNRFNNSGDLINSCFGGTLWEAFYNLFIKPAAFQLWFLRDLLVMLALTPLLWWITKRSWIVAVIMAFVTASVYWPWLIYYWLGLIMAIQKWNVENYPKPIAFMVACIVLFMGYAVSFALDYEPAGWLEAPVNLMGLYIAWTIYDWIARGRCFADKGLWRYICGYSFFIYCFHEPAFNIIKKLALMICGTSEPVLIFFYFINPWLMVAMTVIIARLLQRIMPRVYKILTGGR